jgi:hypothetical protein
VNPKSHEVPKCQTLYSGTNFGTKRSFPQRKREIWRLAERRCANPSAQKVENYFNLKHFHSPKVWTGSLTEAEGGSECARVLDIETCANAELVKLALKAAADRATSRGEDPKAVDPDEVRQEMALSPLWGRIVAVGTLGLDDPAPTIRIARASTDEAELLRWLWQQISEADLVITFNGSRFDCRWVLIRSLVCRVEIPLLPRTFWWGWKPGDTPVRPAHVDLYNLLYHRSRHLRMNLATVCQILGVEPPVGDGADVPRWWAEGRYSELQRHLASDLKATLEVWRKLGQPGLHQPSTTPSNLPF